jgi:hypothetical protein
MTTVVGRLLAARARAAAALERHGAAGAQAATACPAALPASRSPGGPRLSPVDAGPSPQDPTTNNRVNHRTLYAGPGPGRKPGSPGRSASPPWSPGGGGPGGAGGRGGGRPHRLLEGIDGGSSGEGDEGEGGGGEGEEVGEGGGSQGVGSQAGGGGREASEGAAGRPRGVAAAVPRAGEGGEGGSEGEGEGDCWPPPPPAMEWGQRPLGALAFASLNDPAVRWVGGYRYRP